MPVTASVSESNSTATSVVNGTINVGALSGLTVTGLSFAGTSGSGVGTTLRGIFGSLTIQANGSYSYVLDNTDNDTNLLSTGDQATERFVVSYSLGGVVHTFDLNFGINGLDEAGQVTTVTDQTLYLTGPTTFAGDSYLRSTAILGMGYVWQEEGDIEVTFNGSFELNRPAQTEVFEYITGARTNTFLNNGRISIYFDGSSGDYFPGATGLFGIGTNNGVISVVNALPIASFSPAQQALGWGGYGTNNGLIEVVSSHEAMGIWARGNITNNGIILVEGGPFGSPMGTTGIRDGGALLNTGTIRVTSSVPNHRTVAYDSFAGGSNIYANVLRIDNQGTIVADIAFYVTGPLSAATNLSNSGHIEGDLVLDTGVNVVENLSSGSWIGNLALGPQNDIVGNAGSITGNVDLGARGDLFIARLNGSVFGTVHGGADNDILIGAAANDRLAGDDGDDWIEGNGGADTLTGGTGIDTFAYRLVSDSTNVSRDMITDFVSGTDRIDISALGASNFTLTASGEQTILSATTAAGALSVAIVGTVLQGDVINAVPTATMNGTIGSDALAALIASSTLNGLDGNDTLYGSAGDDVLDGGTGADSLFGAAGNDVYYIDSGEDRASEEPDNGTDEIRTTVDYSLQINIENATLLGSNPIGILGTPGDNVLIGNSAPNYFSSNGGNDTLIGGLGGDYFLPGAARLVYRTVEESTVANWDMIDQFQHGATVIDLTAIDVRAITFSDHSGSYMFYNGPHMAFAAYIYGWVNVTIDTGEGQMFMVVSGQIDLSDFLLANAPGSIIPLTGSSTNDLLGGGNGNDEIRGLGGNDTLQGKDGADLIDGGEGNDVASYADATSAISVNLGLTGPQDTLGAGIDTLISIEGLRGSNYDDLLIGTSESNSFDGGGGNDHMYGGTGDDSYRVDSQADLIFEASGGGVDSAITTTNYYMFDELENLTMVMVDGTPTYDPSYFAVGNASANRIISNGGNNLVIGGDGDDVIEGMAGNDLLFGEVGNDAIKGSSGIDYIVGGTGNDHLEGNSAADAIYGGDGDDELFADSAAQQGDNIGSGIDVYYPPDFVTDILVGGAGNDLLHGDSGLADYDLMDGGSGDDTYWVDTGDDLTFEAAGGGTDTVHANVTVPNAGVYLYANVENLVLEGTTAFGVGNELDNQLTGSASGNWLLGGLGSDTLNGQAGNDVLFGEGGADTFVFGAGSGADLIGDFLHGTDRIQLNGSYADFSTLQSHFVQNGADGAIDLGGGNLIVLLGVQMSTLTAGDFIFAPAGEAASKGPAVMEAPAWQEEPLLADPAMPGLANWAEPWIGQDWLPV